MEAANPSVVLALCSGSVHMNPFAHVHEPIRSQDELELVGLEQGANDEDDDGWDWDEDEDDDAEGGRRARAPHLRVYGRGNSGGGGGGRADNDVLGGSDDESESVRSRSRGRGSPRLAEFLGDGHAVRPLSMFMNHRQIQFVSTEFSTRLFKC